MSPLAASSVGQDSPSCVRLYISPLSPAFLDSILAPPTRTLATNFSFHGIDTFPEKNYGYLDLPANEAHSLRRKLNGSFVKGMKLRVEDARPDKRKREASESIAEAQEESSLRGSVSSHGMKEGRARKRSRQDKHTGGVLPAVELSGDRQVKRGWVPNVAEEKRKKHAKPRGAEGKEKPDRSQMIFRTNLPPTVASANISTDKKTKKTDKHDRKSRSTEVKEFTKTTRYPTFLKSTYSSATTQTSSAYIDGKGWVDGEGNVIEAATARKERKYHGHADIQGSPANPMREDSAVAVDETTEQVASDSDDSDETERNEEEKPPTHEITARSITASTGDAGFDQTNPTPSTLVDQQPVSPKLPRSSSTEEKSTSSTTIPLQEVHPLEALFKRPNPALSQSSAYNSTTLTRPNLRPAPIVTSFSFFDAASKNDSDIAEQDAEDEHDSADVHGAAANPPQTPFTRRDLEARGQRSAAPTPDTAAVDKRLSVPWLSGGDGEDDGDDNDDESAGEQEHGLDHHEHNEVDDTSNLDLQRTSSVNEPMIAALAEGPTVNGEQTEFEKQFWANRGEYNRAWKARKREARKEARQAENRRIGRLR